MSKRHDKDVSVAAPTLVDFLWPRLSQAWRSRRWPQMFPEPIKDNLHPAVYYWQSKQAGPNKPGELQSQIAEGVWSCPYYARLAHSLAVFLKESPINQVYIIEHVEKHGIRYNGDPFDSYRNIVEEVFWFREQFPALQHPDDDTDERKQRVVEYAASRMPEPVFQALPYEKGKFLTEK